MDTNTRFPDRDQESPYEEGFPLPEAQPQENQVPGMGKYALPHYLTFSQIVNYASRTYRWTYDEAMRANRYNALAARRDIVVFDSLRTRQMPTVQLPWHIEVEDDQDQAQADMVDYLTDIIEQIPRRQQLFMHLLEALWFGRYGVQIAYRWDYSTGMKRMMVRDHKPINGDKLVFKFSGQEGVLVHATYPGTWQVTDRGRAHFFTPREREQLIIHKHEPEDSDFFEPELGGGIAGTGIRGRIYWFWFLRSQITAFLMDYLERVGAGGLTIYYYEAGNFQSLQEVKTAAEVQWRNNAVLFPRYRDGSTGGPGVEVVQSNQSGAALLQSLITDYFDRVLRRYINGEDAGDATGSGLGSGIADYLEGEKGRRIKYDAVNLAETLTTDLVAPLQKYSPYAHLPPARFCFDVDKPNAGELLGAAQSFFEMGGTIDEDQLRGIIGLEKPQPGHSMLAKMGAMSPAAAGSVPAGVPILGQPGPEAAAQAGVQPPPGAEQGAIPPGGPSAGPPVVMSRARVKLVRLARRVRFADPKVKALLAHPGVLKHANSYLQSVGLPAHQEQAPYHPVNVGRAKRIADVYTRAKHEPENPAVRHSYEAFKKEILAQYNHLLQQGVKFEPWLKEGQPYANSKEMSQDARNGHLAFFTGGEFPQNHLMTQPSGVKHGGRDLTHNDLFRAVHDYFGHALYGNEFGPRGEEHAYRTHAAMFSPEARPAMAAETRGQNSFVNFGPHMRDETGELMTPEHPGFLPPAKRPFGEQKNFLLPESLTGE